MRAISELGTRYALITVVSALLFFLWSPSLSAAPHAVTLKEILSKAADTSPEVESARMRAVAAQHRIEVERAGYLPTVNLEAADSTGFPGSTGQLGTGGLLASPYRVGATAGVVASIPIWDFGRTSNAVEASEHDARSQEEEANYLRYQVYQTALHLFYECTLYRDLKDTWKGLADDAELVRDAVEEFVKKGQRSVVEKYLVESEMERALTQVSVNDERGKMQIAELSLVTEIAASDIQCPHIPHEAQAIAFFHGTAKGNPIILQAMEAAAAARSRVDEAKSGFLPKLMGVANLGVMQDVRLIPERNFYALGVAIVLPVFEGFRTTNQVHEANALAASAEKELASRRLQIADLNAKYDKMIRSTDVSVEHLRDELKLAQNGFSLAKKRYLNLEGNVVDVREAFRNLSRTQIDLLTEKAAYLEAMGAKAVLNGVPF